MKRHYCTYFDRNYLVRGLALIDSLGRYSAGDWEILIICMDVETYSWLKENPLPNVSVFQLAEVETADPELATCKNNRTRVEYLWTTTPAIILWLLKNHLEIELLTYLDADLWFYSSPEPIFRELANSSVLIHEHRYPPEMRDMEINGKYNVGLLCFRNNEQGMNALRWWRERCIESCELDIANGKCGDQMYLNDWPKRFSGVHVLQHIGAGTAPWNVTQYQISQADETIQIDDQPLVFYHFHGLSITGRATFRPAYRFYLRPEILALIYRPYTAELTKQMQRILEVNPQFSFTWKRPGLAERIWDFLFSFSVTSKIISQIRQRLRQ